MKLVTIQKAAEWASDFLKKEVSSSNISYLIQYGKVHKHRDNGATFVNLDDLRKYYRSYNGWRETNWKERLGKDLNWTLSFDHLREKDTTKHVHRLHPYKGKFIPQLVEYFVDEHTDKFKQKVYFRKDDIILDPFMGSGTALVQANELGIHSIGIDISKFNCLIAKSKLQNYDLSYLQETIKKIILALNCYEKDNKIGQFEENLLDELYIFNQKYFPSPGFRYKVNKGIINEEKYATEKEKEFLPIYEGLVRKYNVKLQQSKSVTFLDQWFIQNARNEINFTLDFVRKEKDPRVRILLAIILSRTVRSCRATTHSDLATLKEPQFTTYYCHKHRKICKPLFSIKKMFNRYAYDTLVRIREFKELRTDSYWSIITTDGREVDIFSEIKKESPSFFRLLSTQRIQGIFSSPPYVGQIDYHEQHAYAYELFGLARKDELEIGPLNKGQSYNARQEYIQGIADVLKNCRKFLAPNFDVFLVANDKYNLYPAIAAKSNMMIVNRFKRPVLNRTERDRNPYSEIIFHFRESK